VAIVKIFSWLWDRWKNQSRVQHKPKRQRTLLGRGRRLVLESLETRRMLDGSIASILASDTPNPHPTGDPPSYTSQIVSLTSYTAPPLFDPGIPAIEPLIQGLQEIYNSISSNAQARPSYWGESVADGGDQYELHLNDNGMLVRSWTVNWGDGSDPQQVSNQPWVVHTYAGNTSQYAITVTASSVDGTFTGGIGDSPGALDQAFNGSSFSSEWSSHGPFSPDWAGDNNGDGQQTTNFESGSGFDQATAVALDNGNILVVGITGTGTFGLVRYIDDPGGSDDGQPDTSFGSGGLVTTTFSAGNASASAVAVDSTNGKIVVAGVVVDGSGHNEVALARYNDSDGSLDTTFGPSSTGLVTLDMGTGWTSTNAVAIEGDGSILVAGSMDGHFAVLHFHSNGTQDTSFGSSGVATVDFGGTDETPAAMALDSSGLILVAGTTTQSGTGQDFALARLNTDGSLDTIYGLGGTITTDFGGNDVATSMAIQSDGKILVAGYSDQGGSDSFALARYIATDYGLSIDNSFGTDGLVTTSFGDGDDVAAGVAVDADGRIVVGGSTLLDSNGDVDSQPHMALARYLSDGSLDTSFGTGEGSPAGTVTTDFSNLGFTTDTAAGLVVDADGRLIEAGTATQADYSSFAVSCYDPGTSSLGLDVNDVPPTLQLFGNQVAATSQEIDLSPLGRFTHAPDTGGFTYSIDWGDETTPDTGTATIVDEGSGTTPLVGTIGGDHTYQTAGVYYVTATVTDPDGGSDTQTLQVTVNAPVLATSADTAAPAAPAAPASPSTTDDTVDPPPAYPDQSPTDSAVPVTSDGLQITLDDSTDTPDSASVSSSDSGDGSFGPIMPATQTPVAPAGGVTQPLLSQAAVSGFVTGVTPDPALLAAVRQALAIPAGVSVLPNDWARLTTLTADSNQVLSLNGLQNAVNLQSLTLIPSNFADPGHLTDLSPLTGLTNLKSLTLQCCGLTDSLIATLPTLPSLQTLDLRYNAINVVPQAVADQPKLASLFLYGNPLAGNASTTWYKALAGLLITVDIAPANPQDVALHINPADPTASYQALARAFYDLPLSIYQYLVNTIQYEPYMGAMKGPLATLETSSGNDWDTDWLLADVLAQVASDMPSGGIATSYVTGQIQIPIQQAEEYVGATDPLAAQQILNNADQSALRVVNTSGQVVSMQFLHTWLSVQIVTPNGTVTMPLDPSWKLRDYQSDSSGVAAGTDLLTSLVPFDQSDYLSPSSANLATVQSESAAEYYEAQVRTYLASNDPSETIADIAYTGPIQPQIFSAAPTALPYTVLSQSSTVTSVPNWLQTQVEITLVGPGFPTQPSFSETFALPQISLSRLTIAPNVSGTSATPSLLLDGTTLATFSSSVSSAAATQLSLTITVTSPDPDRSYSHTYNPYANQYLAIGLDANQMSDEKLAGDRATVNAQEVAQADGLSTNTDAEVGGLLALSLDTFFDEADQGDTTIDGLTGAVKDYTWVASALVSSSATVSSSPINSQLQLPYQPTDMSLDLPDGSWTALPISSADTDTVRLQLLGYENSSLEGLVWEELTNYASISTMSAFQLASQDSISPTTVTPSDVSSESALASLLPNLVETDVAGYTADFGPILDAIYGDLTNPIHKYTVSVLTHTLTIGSSNPEGAWTGVGYTLTPNIGVYAGNTIGFIIQGEIGGVWQAPNGGDPAGNLASFTVAPSSQSNSTVGEPVNPSNGEATYNATDFSIPNLGTPLEMVRYYNSSNTAASSPWSDRGMGDGWSFSYSDTIAPANSNNDPSFATDPSGTLVWFTDSGLLLTFTPKTGGGYNTPPTVFGTLTTWSSGGQSGYLWTDKTGSTATFTTIGSTAYLTQIKDRYGNGVSVSRNSSTGYINTVSDLIYSDRYLSFTYTGNHITAIADFTGRTWLYNYDTSGRLVSVTEPITIGAPISQTDYSYDTDTTLNDLLNTVTVADGDITQFSYYVNRRGFQETDAQGDVQSFSYNVYRDRTAFTNELGQTTYYNYDTSGNVVQQLNPDGTTLQYTWGSDTWDQDLKTSDTDEYGQPETYVYSTDGMGNLVTSTNTLGETTAYTYTSFSNYSEVLTAYQEWDGALTTYSYDAFGSLQEMTDSPDGHGTGTPPTFSSGATLYTTSYTYPTFPAIDRGLPLSVTEPNSTLGYGYTTWFAYNEAGQVTTEYVPTATPSSTAPTSGSYASLGYILETSSYDNLGDLTGSTDGNGNTTSYTYNILSEQTSETLPDPDGSGPLTAPTTAFVHDANGVVISSTIVTDSPQKTTSIAVDSLGRTVKTANADGTFTTEQYDAAGNLIYSTDAMGRVTAYIYDSRDRLIITINPDGSIDRTEYDGGSRVVGQTDALGNTTEFVYDKLGRQVEEIQPDQTSGGTDTAITVTTYDDVDDKTFVTDALSTTHLATDTDNTTETDYDKLGRKIEVVQPIPGADESAPTTYYSYDADGNVKTVTDPRGFVTTYYYDESNRKTIEQDSVGSSSYLYTWYYYDSDGNLVDTVDANGATSTSRPTTFSASAADTTQYVYDNLDRKTETIEPTAPNGTRPTTYYVYDQSGNLIATTDADGNTTAFAYNLVDRQTTVTDALGDSTTTVYDAVGNVLEVTDPLGWATTFQYDTMDRKIAETDPLPQAGEAQAVSSVTIAGVGTVVVGGGPTTAWQYDANGNVVATTDPDGNTTWTQYNTWNLPSAVTDALGWRAGDPQHTTTTSYDLLGNVVSVTDPLGRTTLNVYDNLSRKIEEVDPDPSNGSDDSGSPKTFWAYDADGNVQAMEDPLGSVPITLTSVATFDTANTTWYFYDGLGRQTCVVDALHGTSFSYDTTPTSQPTYSTMTSYDALGDVSSTTDELGRTTLYVYDNLGRKIEEFDPDPITGSTTTSDTSCPETTFSYDDNGNLLSTTDPDGNTTWTDFDALNRPVKTVSADGHSPTDTHYATTTVFDAMGNVLSVTDPDGNKTSYVYDNLNRPIETIDPLGDVSSETHDPDGNVLQTVDADGHVIDFLFDPLNEQVEEDWLDGNGNVFHTIHTYYDADGEKLAVTESDSDNPSDATSYQYTYDSDGRMLTSRMAPGDLTETPSSSATHNGVLNSSSPTVNWNGSGTADLYGAYSVTLSAGEQVVVSASSSAFHNVAFAQPPGGNTSNWLIDSNGLGGGNASLVFTVTSATAGTWFIGVTSMSPTASGAYTLSIVVDQHPFVPTGLTNLTYTYYANGSTDTVTDSSDVWDLSVSGNTATTTYFYDAVQDVTTVKQSGTGAYSKEATFTYYANGQTNTETFISNPGSSQTTVAVGTDTYDDDERLTNLAYTHGGSPITTGGSDIRYGVSYDAASNITQIVSADGTDNLTLDNSDQLQTATGEDLSYDQNGNQTSGGYVTGADNRLLFDGTYHYQYDKDGNRTARFISSTGKLDSSATEITIYAWDYENRLATETTYSNYSNYQSGTSDLIVAYSYDYLGDMIRRAIDPDGSAGSDPTTYTYTVYDGQNPYLVVSDSTTLGGSGTPAVSQRDLYATAVDQILATDAGSGSSSVMWGLADYEGTIRDVVNDSGTDQNHVQFDAFGKPISGTIATDFLFGLNGMRWDPATNEYRTETDAYDPSTGQRLSQDDLGFASGTTNLTAWAGNSPVQNADPSGECPIGAQNYSAGSAVGGSDYSGLPGIGSVSRTIGSFGAIPGGIDLNSLGIDSSSLTNVGPQQDSVGPNFMNTIPTAIGAGSALFIIPSGDPAFSLPPIDTTFGSATDGTITVFRKMSIDEAQQSLVTQELLSPIPGSNSNKYVSESLSKVQEFQNQGVAPGTDEAILQYNMDIEMYTSMRGNAIPQQGSNGSGQIVYNTEGTVGTGLLNLGVPGSQLSNFNNAVQSVEEVPPTSAIPEGLPSAPSDGFLGGKGGAIGFATIVSAANAIMTTITNERQLEGLQLIADPTSSPNDALQNIQYFRDVTTGTWAMIFGSIDTESRQYDAQGNPLQTKMEAFLDSAEHYWSAQKINRQAQIQLQLPVIGSAAPLPYGSLPPDVQQKMTR
jgi:uncharacterized delta-60 repeat protein/RHS repeat-associated protein